jgi:hypothetical protein
MKSLAHVPSVYQLVGLLIVVLSTPAVGQDLGRLIGEGEAELGYTLRWFERDVESEYDNPVTWFTPVFQLRYGLTSWLTFSVEGNITVDANSKYPERDYRDLMLGGGITISMVTRKDLNIFGSVLYSEMQSLDRSIYRHDKQVQSVLTGIGVQHTFAIQRILFSTFISPVYVYDVVKDYTDSYNSTGTSQDNFGLSLGLSVTAFDHASIFGQVIFANYWQPRMGLGYTI